MKISFDFDGTLDRHYMQELAQSFINRGDEVWIVTSRVRNPVKWNKDVEEVATMLGIRNNIFYTEGDNKWKFLKNHAFDFHFDNDVIEFKESLKNGCPTIIIPTLDLLEEI